MTSEYLSLKSGLALSRRSPSRFLMMLRGYYDGNGREEDSEFLTLTGLVASESVWEDFEVRWQVALRRHGVRSFRMSDAMALEGEFSIEKGWNDERVDVLLRDLWGLLKKFRSGGEDVRSNLTAVSCTMVMRDYRRAKMEHPHLIEPEEVCMQYCLQWPVDLDDDSDRFPEIVMVFDRENCFQETISRVWERLRTRSEAGWLRQIKNIVHRNWGLVETSATNMAPLEATEMIAWLVNNRYKISSRMRKWDFTTIIAIEPYIKTYDYATLTERYCGA